MLIWLTHSVGMPYFKLVRKPIVFDYTMDDLGQMPTDTVGYNLFVFLKENDLHLLPYYEKHDIKHIVLGYPPTECGEVCLQCFMLANGRYTLPVLIAVVFGCLTMPEYWSQFWIAIKRGWNNKSLQQVTWFDLLPFSFKGIQSMLLQPKSIAHPSLINL